jgi:hypothetical protein
MRGRDLAQIDGAALEERDKPSDRLFCYVGVTQQTQRSRVL